MSIASKFTVMGAVLCVAGCGSNAALSSSGPAASQPQATAGATPGAAAGTGGAAATGSELRPAPVAGGAATPTATANAGAGGATASPSPAAGSGGASGSNALAAAGAGALAAADGFSFFVTSLQGMRELSKNELGFGGDLRYGESTGLKGADKICTELAERSKPGAGAKGWRAFLSAAKAGDNGGPVHAKDRIGTGPWYDRLGRLVAANVTDLLTERPKGADPAIIDDLPNERGEPNHTDTMPDMDDNHDVVTATNASGMWDGKMTCEDWTTTETPAPPVEMEDSEDPAAMMGPWGDIADDGPGLGHSWPSEFSGASWLTVHRAPGCGASVALVQMGPGSGVGIGNGGGYGGIYCFALKP